MNKFIEYVYNEAPILSVERPSKKNGGEKNDGTYFEIGISLINWKSQNSIPKKKDIKGEKIEFSFEDLDNDETTCYLGEINDYRFVDSYKKDLIIQIIDAKKKSSSPR